jgi:hypothetical protein
MKVAEALVLRKHLEAKVKQLEPIKVNGDNGVFEFKTERVNVNDQVDEVKMQIPKVQLADITKQYDMYSKALRQLDTAIQQANWLNDVDVKLDEGIAV